MQLIETNLNEQNSTIAHFLSFQLSLFAQDVRSVAKVLLARGEHVDCCNGAGVAEHYEHSKEQHGA